MNALFYIDTMTINDFFLFFVAVTRRPRSVRATRRDMIIINCVYCGIYNLIAIAIILFFCSMIV